MVDLLVQIISFSYFFFNSTEPSLSIRIPWLRPQKCLISLVTRGKVIFKRQSFSGAMTLSIKTINLNGKQKRHVYYHNLTYHV
jgi:hypothetical protein